MSVFVELDDQSFESASTSLFDDSSAEKSSTVDNGTASFSSSTTSFAAIGDTQSRTEREEVRPRRDLGTLLLDAGDELRYYIKLVFIVLFIMAFTHGAFIVLLALKLDNNSIFNWNVTLLPLAIYYGLWFVIAVVGFTGN